MSLNSLARSARKNGGGGDSGGEEGEAEETEEGWGGGTKERVGEGKEGEGSRFISAVATPLSLAMKSEPATLPLPNPEGPCKGMEEKMVPGPTILMVLILEFWRVCTSLKF